MAQRMWLRGMGVIGALPRSGEANLHRCQMNYEVYYVVRDANGEQSLLKKIEIYNICLQRHLPHHQLAIEANDGSHQVPISVFAYPIANYNTSPTVPRRFLRMVFTQPTSHIRI